ncbi:MAG TPA: M1 family metallopeptidase, partial [Longimicrobium sp.]|nr:M1 family metallopeptidase [Longimicrobium sp.]
TPLAPGASVTVVMDWTARPSTLPRRQGRKGRHLDWAQWYPRIAVYDRTGWAQHPLLPQGELYGEFGAYDVTLDVAADQVIGATGVAVEGDPGYTVSPHELGFYPARAAEPLGLLTGDAGAGRKRVRFRAEKVHHFGWSADPTYRHQGVTRESVNDAGEAATLPTIHVLYLPADTGWSGAAPHSTYAALQWNQELFGPYPWPQLTNLHRLESGGTEFPMVIMNGSPSEGLIVHETTHQWLHGIFGNNEWKQGWMDEGFTSFVTAWYNEAKGDTAAWTANMRTLERLERADSAQPVDLPGEAYVNPRIYTAMTYTKGSAVFRMLRDYLGEQTFRRALRDFYACCAFRHVTGDDFRRAAERASGQDLGWFWAQWLERTDWLDYGVADVRSTPLGGGRWRTRVTVLRAGPAWMPVTVQVGDETRRLSGRARRQTVEVVTRGKPDRVVVDPKWVLIDPDRSNNTAPVQ